MKCRVAMAQIRVEGGQPEANLARAVASIEAAGKQACQLVVLPECLDLGWTDPCAREMAQPIPGPHVACLAQVAKRTGLYVVAGLVEHAGDRIYNAAVLIDRSGSVLLHHRKINELELAHDLYSTGNRLEVAETGLGILGIDICADNFADSLAIGHVLARMGAQLLLSPSAWAVDSDHDNRQQPYGRLWRESYCELARLYDITVIGVSHVGRLTAGPWKGRKVIGCSLAVGPGGEILAEGPYGDDAEALIVVDVDLQPPIGQGTGIAPVLRGRGYNGP